MGFFFFEGILFCVRIINLGKHKARWFLFFELFYVQILSYLYSGILFIEFLFIPIILSDISFLFPVPWSLIMEAVFGIGFSTFMSYSLFAGTVIEVGHVSFPFWMAVLPLYSAVAILSSYCALMNYNQNKMTELHESEMKVNQNLESMNRIISRQIFTIKAESEQSTRKLVTKDIHVSIGYIFTNLIMMLQATEAVYNREPEKAGPMISNCVNYSCTGMNDIRFILRKLRRSDENSIVKLQRDLKELASLFSRCTGTSVIIDYGNWPRSFTPRIDSFFLSFMKETITNAVKHGMATAVHITCWQEKHVVTMTVEDNGLGAQGAIIHGIGIQSIQDDLQQLDGRMEIHSSNGFFIRVLIPY